MSKLHSVGRANKGLFGSLRLFALAGFVAAAGLVTAPLFAQTCEFDDPTAAADGSGGWKEDSGSFGIEYLFGGTNETTALPTVSATNAPACPGEGDLSYKLYMADGTTALTATDVGGTMTFVLLTLADGMPTADPAVPSSTISVPENSADAGTVTAGATVSYNTASSDSDFHRMAPGSYVLKAEKAFSGGVGAEFAFTVTVRPVPHAAPTDVFAVAESNHSVYVEWTGDGNNSTAGPPATPDTSATSYVVTATYTPMGAMMPTMSSTTVMDSAMTGEDAATAGRQSATLTGLPAGESFTISVMGVSGTGFGRNEGTSASPAAAVATAALTYTSETPYKLSVGETVNLDVSDFFTPSIDESATDVTADDPTNTDDPTNDNVQRPVGTTFMVGASTGNTAVSVEHITDEDGDHTDDILRMTGLAEGTYTVTLTATTGTAPNTTTLMARIPVSVIENHTPVFKISQATFDWDVDNVGMDFYVNVMSDFVDDLIFDEDENVAACMDEDASNDYNCDHEITFTLSGGQGVLGITEDNEQTGRITVTAMDLTAVENGRQFELTVTATDQSGAKDTMKIFVDVIEGNDIPVKRRTATDIFLQPLAAASGGGSRSTNVAGSFSDIEGDDLCFEITGSDLTGMEDGQEVALATASLSGASTCMNGNLTITMNTPSIDPEDPNFVLLGRYGTDRVSVTVAAFQRGATPKVLTDGVTVYVDLVYGPNTGPSIRTVAKMGDAFFSTGIPKIMEGESIRLTFTADDAQPTGDRLCWSQVGRCTPCQGAESTERRNPLFGTLLQERRGTTRTPDNVSHEYDLVVPGSLGLGRFQRTVTDFETTGGVYTINLCATDLSGETDRVSFQVQIEDVEEAPYFADDFDHVYMVVGDYSQNVNIWQNARDGDGRDDIDGYGANCIGGCQGALTITESEGVLTITPTQNEMGAADKLDVVDVEIEVSVTDSTGRTAYSTINATVKDRNNAPSFTDGLTAASYRVAENSSPGTRVGGPLAVGDVDEGDAITASVSGTDMFRAAVVRTSDADDEEVTHGVQISVAKPGLDFEGKITSYDFTVTVEDKYGGSDTVDVRVDLTDRNEAPTKTDDDIPDQRILVGLTLCPIDADDHFMDPDHRDQQAGLLIDVSSTRPGDAEVSVGPGNEICIKGRNVGSGPSRVRVTASDREGLSVFKTFLVTVEHNMPPMVAGDGIADQTAQEGGRMMNDLHLDYFFDDGDATYDEHLTYSVSVADSTIATPALRGTGNVLRVYGDTKGLTDVTVTATDQNGQSVSDMFEIQVVRNYAPMADNDAIGMQQQYIGKVYDPIDATMSFMDEGDELDYAITTSDPDIATVAIKYDEMGGPWIVAHLHMPGMVYVTMTATDSARQSAEIMFELLVHARNDPPTIANAIADMEIIELRSMDVMLDGVFEDDYDMLEIVVENEDEGVADVVHRMRENLIRIYANVPGMTKVTVTATDDFPADQPHGPQMVVDEFTITVVPNHPPVVANPIADQSVIVYKSIDVSLAGVFTDANDDPLDITAESANEDVATVELIENNGEGEGADSHPDDYTLRITGVSVDSTTIILTATDPGDLSVQHKFEIEVESDKPFVVEGNEIPDQMLDVTMPIMVSLEGVFGDPEDEPLTYSVETGDEGVATAMVDELTVTITGVMVGETTGTVTATDPYGNTAMDTFNITVINAGPMVVGMIEDQTLTVVDPAMVDVADAFSDPDGDELTFSASSSNEDAATVSVEGSMVTVTGVKVGETTVTVTAMDPAGLYVMSTFMATVENAAPMAVGMIEDQTLTVVDPVSVSVMDAFMDPDGDELTYSAMSSNEDAATVSVDGYMVTVTGVKRGETMITVTATDPGGLYAMTTFMATVVNAAPMVANEIADQTLTVVDPAMVSIADTFMDPDGDEMTYSVMSSNEAAATAMLDGTDLMITGVKVGFTTITVTATDPEGLYVMTSFEAEVENAAPQMVGTLDDQVVTRGEPITVSISGVFMDPDGDPLSYATASADASIATASISGESMTIDGLAPGTTSITVTASDPDGLSASGSYEVRVETIPEPVGSIADVTLQVGGESMTMSIAQYFEDDDGDALTYAVSASGSAATASIAGADLTLAPHTRGSSGITITASDPKGRSATQSFTANVSDSELQGVAEMALAHHGRAILSGVSAAFGSRLEGDRANSGLSFGRFSQYLPLKAGEVPTGGNTALSAGGSTYRDVSDISWTGSSNGLPQQSAGLGSIPNLASFLDPQNFRSFSHTLNGNGGVNSWSVWGGFDTQTFEGEGYEGDATSLFLGVDLQTHICWLFGVAIASNTGESDYTWGSATQTMETSLTTILPYVRYEPTTGDTSVWGVVGSGSGEAESTVVNAANQTSDLSFTLGLGGLRHDFGESGNFNLAVRADVGFANIETASGDGAIDGLSAGVNRLRAGIEASMDVDPGNGGSLTPFGELAVRNDGGDGVTGTGLEVAGGIRFSQDAFSFEARGRVTATHGGEDFSEQGISVVAAFRPAADGSGLSLSVEPRWGQTTSATQSFVWNETATIGVGSVAPEANVLRNDNGKSIDTVLGYGFRVGGDRYMLRPFVDVRSGSLNGKTTLLGAELKNLVPGPFAIETRFVFGKADIGSTKQNQIGLDARIVF